MLAGAACNEQRIDGHFAQLCVRLPTIPAIETQLSK